MGDSNVDAARWRCRAAEARAEAGRMRNPDAMRAMLELAEVCERLAAAAETGECGPIP